MATSSKPNHSLYHYQDLVKRIYGPKNMQHFTVEEMLTNINRFTMRALKGIRKGDMEKMNSNCVIALSWFLSLMSQLSIDIEDQIWQRFPYLCSYCGECPCVCKTRKIKKRVEIKVDSKKRPADVQGLQKMFNDIYPASGRTLEHAGIHLAEETGELSEAVLKFRGHHGEADFGKVILEAADLYSCFMGVFNSVDFDYQAVLDRDFAKGCHVCHKIPCECPYDFVINYKS